MFLHYFVIISALIHVIKEIMQLVRQVRIRQFFLKKTLVQVNFISVLLADITLLTLLFIN